MDSWMTSHHLPHSCAICRWRLYSSRFNISLSLSLFWAVLWDAGDVFGTFSGAYLGITLLCRHCWLKYILALHLAIFVCRNEA